MIDWFAWTDHWVSVATIGDVSFIHNEQFVIRMSDLATRFAWHQDGEYSVFNSRLLVTLILFLNGLPKTSD